MSTLLFAIFAANAAHSRVAVTGRALRKTQAAYDRAETTAERRDSSRDPNVRQRAQQALGAALDALDTCRAAHEAEQVLSDHADAAERAAYAAPLRHEESPTPRQYRNAHA